MVLDQVTVNSAPVNTSLAEMLKVVSGMTGTVAVTDTDLELEPPDPEQLKEKVYEPAGVIVNAVLPEVAFVPSQDPLAEQEEALVLDQVIVATSPATNSVEDMLKVVTGATRAGGVGAGALPPPPPPPHPNKKINAKK